MQTPQEVANARWVVDEDGDILWIRPDGQHGWVAGTSILKDTIIAGWDDAAMLVHMHNMMHTLLHVKNEIIEGLREDKRDLRLEKQVLQGQMEEMLDENQQLRRRLSDAGWQLHPEEHG